MRSAEGPHGSRVAVVADVGRNTIRLGLTDDRGRLRRDTVRAYDYKTQTTVSGAITAFGRDCALGKLPNRCAIAVSGVPRGDVISVTHSRWIVSRSGLAGMLQGQPLILNDFAANAWAISSPQCSGRSEALTPRPVKAHDVGAFCIIGVGSGLGVALLSRDEHGIVSVTPSESGHTNFISGLPGAAPILDIVGARTGYVTAEMLLSGPGLMAIYMAIAKLRGLTPRAQSLGELLDGGSKTHDPVAFEAFSFFGRAFWHFAGNMCLAYGAWDGVIITGSVAAAMRRVLGSSDMAQHFIINGPFRRRLMDIPRSIVTFEHAELEGAAVALLMDDARRSVRPLAA